MVAEDEQQQKTLSCSKSVRQLTLERDQAMADLNSVERSFADLFRRYENMKGVLEGFKKVSGAVNPIMQCGKPSSYWHITGLSLLLVSLQNEEVLKKCAQDYLMRIKQEEQRYQTLKVHAEEKLDKWVSRDAHLEKQQEVKTDHLTVFSSSSCLLCSHRANEEIAQVRAKANAEGVALNASLRKEQMKVESLERAVVQKVGWLKTWLQCSRCI